jgi:TP901 family phage tail tape measure protein
MAERSVVVRIKANIDDFRTGMQQAGRAANDFGQQLSGRGSASREQMEQIGRAGLVMSGSLVLGLGMAAKAAIDWESAWAGVTKTVDGSEAQMAELEDGLRNLATSLPATHAEIAAVAEAAGQLGVAAGDVEAFTRVMIDLGETTNLTSDEAATSIAQMMNIMKTAPDDVERLASTLVLLGNNGASTEREILDMSLRLAGAGELIGATEGEVLALANAMASLGIESQLGGGAMSRTIMEMYDAVQTGSESLEVFAATAGMSADEFAEAFRTSPVDAINEFVQGMGRIQAEGGNLVTVLADVGLSGTQDAQVLLRLAGAGDLLTESLVMQETAWQENTALSEEAAKRYETTAAQMQVLRNQISDLAITVGDKLLPAIGGVVDLVGNLVTGFSTLPGPLQTAGTLMATFGAATFGVVGVVGTMAPKVIAAMDALRAMGTAGQFAARHMRSVATGGAAVGAAFTAFSMYQGMMEEATASGQAYAESQAEIIGSITDFDTLAATLDNAREMAAGYNREAANSRSPFDHEYRAELRAGADGLYELVDAQQEMVNAAEDLAVSQGIGRNEALALVRAQEAMAASAEETAVDLDAMAASMSPEQTAALASELGVTEEALEGVASATEAADEAFKEYQDTLHASFDPLFGAVDAMNDLAEAQSNVTAAEWAVVDAQKAYNDAAREHGRNSKEATDAALAVYAAQEELAAANDDVVRSAFAVDEAMTGLRIGLESGSVSVETATDKLQGWVDQGLITQGQADAVTASFGRIASQSDKLDGRKPTITVVAETAAAEAALGRVAAAAGRLSIRMAIAMASGKIPQFDDGGVMPGQRGVHSLALVAGGETILPTHKASFSPGQVSGLGGGGRSVSVNAPITVNGASDVAHEVERSVETLGWRLSLTGAS